MCYYLKVNIFCHHCIKLRVKCCQVGLTKFLNSNAAFELRNQPVIVLSYILTCKFRIYVVVVTSCKIVFYFSFTRWRASNYISVISFHLSHLNGFFSMQIRDERSGGLKHQTSCDSFRKLKHAPLKYSTGPLYSFPTKAVMTF